MRPVPKPTDPHPEWFCQVVGSDALICGEELVAGKCLVHPERVPSEP